MGFGLVIGFTGLLKLVIIINYSAIADSHTLQFTVVRTQSSQSALSSPVIAWQRILTVSSLSVLMSLPVGYSLRILAAGELHSLTAGSRLSACRPAHSLRTH
jgi:hypothetical protein